MKTKLQNTEQKRFAAIRAESVNLEDRTAEFVISTEAVDTYETVFLMSGWDLSRYQKNPVVLFNHNAQDADHVIGTSEVRVEDKQLVAVVTFEPAEINPLAEKILRKVQAGTIRGASIRADVMDGRFGVEADGEDPNVLYFTRQELMEWSIVTLNSNPDALARQESKLQALRSALSEASGDEDTTEGDEKPSAETENENRASSFDAYEAQLIINQNQ